MGRGRARRKANEAEEEHPARRALRRRATVIGLIAGTLQIVAWVTVLLVVMSELGVPLGPLFASAGIAGVALGFGAQTVVKDTLAGLFIAMEGQFDVGDVLDLQTEGGLVTGSVEGLTLRGHDAAPVRRHAQHHPERVDPGHQQQDAGDGDVPSSTCVSR